MNIKVKIKKFPGALFSFVLLEKLYKLVYTTLPTFSSIHEKVKQRIITQKQDCSMRFEWKNIT